MEKNNQSGLTLLEMIVAIGIISVIILVLSQTFISTTRGSVKTDVQSEVKQSGDFSVRTLEYIIRSAESITSACPSGGSTSRTLDLKNPDGTIFSMQCAWDNGKGISRIASVSAQGTSYLTPEGVTLGGNSCATDGQQTLWFTCTKPAGEPSSVVVRFTLYQSGVAVSAFEKASQAFQTTIMMRN